MAQHEQAQRNRTQNANTTAPGGQSGQGTQLGDAPMMKYLLDALRAGTDIGHYGRLTFVIVARYFVDEDELLTLLERQPGVSQEDALALVAEVKQRDYSPPQRDTILRWQQRQPFPICPDTGDPHACDVYHYLRFPDSVYNHIQEFYVEQAEAQSDRQESHGQQ
jgi:hypothetical protein